jgi:cytochrome b561
MVALVALHILAALKHHFIDKDQILARMFPRRT